MLVICLLLHIFHGFCLNASPGASSLLGDLLFPFQCTTRMWTISLVLLLLYLPHSEGPRLQSEAEQTLFPSDCLYEMFCMTPYCVMYDPNMCSIWPVHVFCMIPTCVLDDSSMYSVWPEHVSVRPEHVSVRPEHVFCMTPACFLYDPSMSSVWPQHVFCMTWTSCRDVSMLHLALFEAEDKYECFLGRVYKLTPLVCVCMRACPRMCICVCV